MTIHEKLKAARTRANLTQEQVIAQLGISRQTLSNWENGRSSPDIPSVVKLSDLYGISLDQLLKESAPPESAASVPFLKRYWDVIYEAAIITLPLAYMAQRGQMPLLALILCLSGLLLFAVPRLLFHRYFGGSIKQVLPGILGWCLVILHRTLWTPENPTGIYLLLTSLQFAGIMLVIYTVHREFQGRKKPVYRFALAIWVIIGLAGVSKLVENTGGIHVPSMFGHTFRVSDVLYPEDDEGPKPQIELYKGVQDIQLRFMDPITRDWETAGVIKESPNGWQVIPEENSGRLYQLTNEDEDHPVLAYFENDMLQWKYQLSRVDIICCTASPKGSLITWWPEWYETDTYPIEEIQSTTFQGESELLIILDDPGASELTLYEAYYHDGDVTYAQYPLVSEEGPQLAMRYDSGEQYVIYRIPYENGEFITRVHFKP